MKTTVLFKNVSKRYRLGLTRTSLPSLFSQQLSTWFKQPSGRKVGEKFLWALRDVSFELAQGQSLALIGPNGAGKTTILKLLANITQPTSGGIETNGKLSALIELGAGFHPDLTGRENVYLNGTILGLSRSEIDRRFDEIVAFSELESFLDTPLKRYSSGMSVRLGFSVAACIDPDILLVDEVLAVGDAAFRQRCMERIQSMLDKGTSIIFVSHNLWLVQAVCERALYIDHGQVKHRGETSETIAVYDRALNRQRAEKFEKAQLVHAEVESDVEIEKIEILGKNGLETDKIRADQPVEVRVCFLAFRDLNEITAVVRILRSDGLTCCMMRSNLDGFRIPAPSGAGTFSLMLEPVQLTGGTHYAQVILRDASDTYGLTSASSKWFYVQNTSPTFSYSSMNGVFEPTRRWSFELPSRHDSSNDGRNTSQMGRLQSNKERLT